MQASDPEGTNAQLLANALLRAEIAEEALSRHASQIAAAEARSAALARALDEAKEALRPFAEAANDMDENGLMKFEGIRCGYGPCARARSILEPGHEG